jgi:hypothetical protein
MVQNSLFKTVKNGTIKTVQWHYGLLHNSTLQSQSIGPHQPMDCWVDGVLLVVIDHIQGVRLGQV